MSVYRINGPDFRIIAREILAAGNRVRFQAGGESMHPFIQDGDILEVAPLSNSLNIKIGDVLLVYSDSARLLAHRVIKINNCGTKSYLIKADAGTSPDGWFRTENILGRVEVKERAGLRIILTSSIRRWKALVWVFLAPWVIWFLWLPVSLRRHVRDWLLVK